MAGYCQDQFGKHPADRQDGDLVRLGHLFLGRDDRVGADNFLDRGFLDLACRIVGEQTMGNADIDVLTAVFL